MNVMRRLFIVTAIVLIALAAFPTAQRSEHICDNGVDKYLNNILLYLDRAPTNQLEDSIPKEFLNSSLHRNYVGYWKISNDSLFLDSIIVPIQSRTSGHRHQIKLDDVLASRLTPSGYFVDWVTDTLHIVSGRIVNYVHDAWFSTWEHEEFVAVENGIVKGRRNFENRRVNEGLDERRFYEQFRNLIDSLELGELPHRMVMSVGYSAFDSVGNPTGIDVDIKRSSGDAAIDSIIVNSTKDWMMRCRPLMICCINGSFKSDKRFVATPIDNRKQKQGYENQ